MLEIKPHLKNLYRTVPDEKRRGSYLRLDMNENVSGLPQDLVREVLDKIDPEFLATYPEYRDFQKKIAAYNNLQPENICLSNGSDAAIKYIFDAYVSSGDKILVTDPTFAMYFVYCEMFDAKPVVITYRQDLLFPEKNFIDGISPDIRLAIIVNPNNPTGSIVENDKLITIIEKAARNNVLMIIDEAYFYFYPETLIEQVKRFENLIVLRTFSKLLGMASLRFGYAAACPAIVENLRKVRPTYDVNGLAVLLAERILDDHAVIKALIRETEEGKSYLIERLSGAGIEFRKGYANFVLIKCFNRVDEIVKRLADENILVQGGFKQEFLKDYIRVTVGNRAIMERFWKSFIDVWQA